MCLDGSRKRSVSAGGSGNVSADAAAGEEEEEEEEVVDYIDWAAAQRAAEVGESGVGGAGFSLEKLDDHVVFGGKVEFALARWERPGLGMVRRARRRKGRRILRVDSMTLRNWIVELQS